MVYLQNLKIIINLIYRFAINYLTKNLQNVMILHNKKNTEIRSPIMAFQIIHIGVTNIQINVQTFKGVNKYNKFYKRF